MRLKRSRDSEITYTMQDLLVLVENTKSKSRNSDSIPTKCSCQCTDSAACCLSLDISNASASVGNCDDIGTSRGASIIACVDDSDNSDTKTNNDNRVYRCRQQQKQKQQYHRNIRRNSINQTIDQGVDEHRGNNNSSFNRRRIVGRSKSSISVISSYWWLYCYCYLCLLSNYASFTVNGAYPDTDELINELDRPSK